MRFVSLFSVVALLTACTEDNPGRPDGRGRTTSGGNTSSTGGGQNNNGCTGLACAQVSCPSGTTTVSGKVTAPNGLDPVYDAMVYVPQTIPEFPSTVQCEVCNEPIGGTPVVTTQTAVDGTFTLQNVPVATQVPIVVQKGRFRRILHVDINNQCADNPLTIDQARLPKNKSEGDLPKMAVAVGDFDQIECVLRSIGIDDKEFTAPGGGGAVELYPNGGADGTGGGGPFGPAGGPSPFEQLLTNSSKLQTYNIVFINCTGNTFDTLMSPTMVTQNLFNYVNTGGRLYVTDWSYDYMEQVRQFAPYIFFEGGGDQTNPQPVHAGAKATNKNPFTATVADSTLASWLSAAGAASGTMIQISDLLIEWVLMHSTAMDQMTYPSQTWIHGNTNGADRPLTVTFDYNMCGKVLYSSYHTREPGGSGV
jgi:hypothetical protein